MRDNIQSWLKKNQITEVECLVPDMTGNARGKIVPASKLLVEDGTRLPDAIFLQTITGEWPDDMSMIHPGEKDMVLRPDTRTKRKVPWAADPTAQIIHDCYTQKGELHWLAPRTVLRKVLDAYAARDLRPVVAPEVEFFLVKRNTDPDIPLEPPVGRSGRPETGRQSFSIDAVNEFDPVFEDMYDFCEAMDLQVDTLIHESGAAQMEINFLHGDPLELADQVFLFKRAMREAAMRHDIYATFMAKPFEREPGSSMHLHQSLCQASTGKNLFTIQDDQPGEMFRHFIGGLQTYVPSAMAFFAPNVNSYRRLASEESAPINVHWGIDNRTCGLRVPRSAPENTRVENRFSGADVNPYVAIAASLACGLLGLEHKLEPLPAVEGSAYDEPYSLARSPTEALARLAETDVFDDLFGKPFLRAWHAIKSKEFDEYFAVISSWEREHLLLTV
jgi:glutamine synthetase